MLVKLPRLENTATTVGTCLNKSLISTWVVSVLINIYLKVVLSGTWATSRPSASPLLIETRGQMYTKVIAGASCSDLGSRCFSDIVSFIKGVA